MQTAHEIYQEVLNGMSIAFLRQDFGLARRLMTLPHRVRTASHAATYETDEDLWKMFNDFCQTLTDRGVTNLVRTVQEARYLDEHCIEGRHRSHFLRNGEPVAAPYFISLRLNRVAGEWRISERNAEVDPFTWDGVFNPAETNASGHVWASKPTDMFQSVLDQRSDAFIASDYDRYRALVDLPYILIGAEKTFVFRTEEQMREGFFRWATTLASQRATDMICSARAVEQLSDDMMVGRYSTHVLNSATEITKPFESSMLLCRRERQWRVVMTANGMTNMRRMIGLQSINFDAESERV